MKKLLLSFLLLTLSYVGFSQSSVYFCTETGALGYSYGYFNSPTFAYDYCISVGGTNPTLILYSTVPGYACIVVGSDENGLRIVGVSAGYSTKEAAQTAAYNSCYNAGGYYSMYYLDTWYDSVENLK